MPLTFVQIAPADLAVTYGPPAGYQDCLGKQSWNSSCPHKAHW